MKPISGPAFAKVAERRGWRIASRERQSPRPGKAGEPARLVIPMHGARDLKPGLQRSLMKAAGFTDDDLS